MNSPAYIEDNIFVELGLANVSDERKVAMLQQMNELIHRRVMIRIMENMPQEAQDQLPTVAEQSPEEQMNHLLQYVPNLEALVQQEVAAVKEELKASVPVQE
ncbi:MAG: hypothetical protein HYV32_04485 [Candidatus Kerfeldbacteria bacterium]|nr:hypothetical protein [Candidatus Kerfeldbacteria bacterium]